MKKINFKILLITLLLSVSCNSEPVKSYNTEEELVQGIFQILEDFSNTSEEQWFEYFLPSYKFGKSLSFKFEENSINEFIQRIKESYDSCKRIENNYRIKFIRLKSGNQCGCEREIFSLIQPCYGIVRAYFYDGNHFSYDLSIGVWFFTHQEKYYLYDIRIINVRECFVNITYVPGESNEPEIFFIVEEQPEFPGGIDSLKNFISTNLQYPQQAREKGIQGRVFVNFVIDDKGNIINIKILSGVDPLLDAEAIRIVQSMPKWKPGKQRGKPVYVSFNLPITFKIEP